MGLLYLFPTSSAEKDYVLIDENSKKLIVTSYGLPWFFWIYSLMAFLILTLLTYSIFEPMLKLTTLATGLDYILVAGLLFIIIASYLSIILFLYWRILIVVTEKNITLEYRPFGILIFKKTFSKTPEAKLEVRHFMDSPNLARINQDPSYKPFQNSGYFELFVSDNQGNQLLLDRSSRKNDLEALKDIISKYCWSNL